MASIATQNNGAYDLLLVRNPQITKKLYRFLRKKNRQLHQFIGKLKHSASLSRRFNCQLISRTILTQIRWEVQSIKFSETYSSHDIYMRKKEFSVTWKPFPFVIPVMSTYCPGTKWRTPIDVPTGRRASSVTGNSLSFLFMGTPWALKWPTSGFLKCFSFFCPHPI